jgi:hypothetical protein
MRNVCVLLLALVCACKEKQEAKPASAPAPTPAPAVKQEPAPIAPAPDAAVAVEHAQPSATVPAGGFATGAEYEAKAGERVAKLTDVFARAGTNCERLADGLDRFVEENKAVLASADAFEAANPSAQNDLRPKLENQTRALMAKLNISMQACQNHARVKAALANLPPN